MSRIADWDDLRLASAAGQHGSFAAAARALAVDAATILRRINGLEKRLECRVFERSRNGLQLTDAGRRVVVAASSIQREIESMELDIAGRDAELKGEIVFSTTDDLAYHFAEPALAAFQRRFPQIVVNLEVENAPVNLNKREADVVLRCTKRPPPLLVGRRLGGIDLAIYAARDSSAAVPESNTRWILWRERSAPPEVARFQREHLRGCHAALRTSSFLVAKRACLAGTGVTILPTFMARSEDGLKRLTALGKLESSELWLLTHQKRSRIPRIRVFTKHIGGHLARIFAMANADSRNS